MLAALSTPRNRTTTFILLAACCALAIAAAVVGIADNPPGIMLALLAAFALVLAFVHPWRAAAPFRLLFYGSFLGLVCFVLAAMVVDVWVGKWVVAHAPGLRPLLEGVWTVAIIVVLALFPPAFLTGLGGWVAMSSRNRRPLPPAGARP